MSVSFGEVVEPTTRAFWDNYEDYVHQEESIIRLNLEWSKNCDESSIPESVETLLIVEGIGISSLINTLVGDGKPLCKIINTDIVLYRINDELIICASNEKDLNKAGEATELIQQFLRNAKKVIGVAIQTSVTYKGPFDDGEFFVRGVNAKLAGIKPLEVPNFITGMVAGCATYRMHSKLDASIYACYVANPFFDLSQIGPIIELLRKLGIQVNTDSFKQNRDNFSLYM